MKVQCGQCPAKYAVADERIRNKKVRIHCKRCNAAIVVDGKVEPPLVTSTPARKSAHPYPSIPPETLPPPEDREPTSRPSPRPVAHTIMGGLEAPAADRLRDVQLSPPPKLPRGENQFPMASGGSVSSGFRPGMPEPDRGFTDPPAGVIPNRWRVALTKQDLRWMTTAEIAEAYQAGAVKLETFVFRAGMPTWVTLLEIPEIALALTGSSEVPPSTPPPRRPPSSRPPPRKSGGRREPEVGKARLEELPHPSGDDAPVEDPFVLGAGRPNGAHDDGGRARWNAAERDASVVRAAPAGPVVPAGAAPDSPREGADGRFGADAYPPPASPLQGPEPSAEQATAPAPFAAGQQSSGSSRWPWVIVAVVVVAALAATLIGPRLGFKVF